MKNSLLLLAVFILTFLSCEKDDSPETQELFSIEGTSDAILAIQIPLRLKARLNNPGKVRPRHYHWVPFGHQYGLRLERLRLIINLDFFGNDRSTCQNIDIVRNDFQDLRKSFKIVNDLEKSDSSCNALLTLLQASPII